jgi:TM2 domain-containing membrane protein YozV
MRGQVLGVDRKSGDGQIAGDDGRRYRFRPHDWDDQVGPAVGAVVDFEAQEGRATSIYRLPAVGDTLPAKVAQAAMSPVRRDRIKIVAALLAFFLGVFGAHRFYLGRTGSAVLMLVLTCTLFGMAITGIWALVDFVRFLAMSNGEFDDRYNR